MNLKFDNKWRVNLMRFAILMVIYILFGRAVALAQMIDFDNGVTNSPTASGFTAWNIDNGTTVTGTFDGVTITITNASGSNGNKISRNWYKNGIQNATSDESKLLSDGITSVFNDNDGDHYVTSGQVAIQLTIKGLKAGTHTLQAYHNNVDYDSATLPNINVKVDGTDQQTGIVQSTRAITLATAAKSYVTFSVSSTSQEVVIVYYTTPVSGTNYNRTQLYINSLEFDVANADYQALSPSPSNLDYHYNCDNGNVTLSWTKANNATRHIVYFGTSENSLSQIYSGTSTSTTRSNLNPKQVYYWRVDEVINGVTYTGTVWSFRPRRLAFPGAEGAGKYAIGGRDGDVYHVTNLNDAGNGSLRYGIENATGPRTIVFDVSGVIQLKSRLVCNTSYITIAGQTAPGIGILLRDYDFGANSDDGITRFMRFRYGHGDEWNGTSANQNVGNAAGLIANYAIMDHCLLGWGSDETFSTRGAKNVSFQHSLIGESLNQNGHKNYYDSNPNVQHGYAATVGGEVGSLHHNLLAHNEGRNWSLGGGLDGTNTFAGRMNIYNNVVYNWGSRATDGGAHQVNFVGNYYKKGPSTTQNKIFIANHEDNFAGTQEYYLNGNLRVSQDGNTKTSDRQGDTYDQTISSGITVNWTTFVSSAYDFYSLDQSNVESAEAAFKNVLSDVGCNYESLDNNEKRLVQETLNGTASKTGSRSGLSGLIDKESDSEGWNGLGIVSESRASDWDTDKDGIPDWFEIAKGWSISSANNNNYGSDNYTNLEEYLNWMACPHFMDLKQDETKTIALATYFAGYINPSYSIVSQDSGIGASISNGNLVLIPSEAGFFTVQVKATESSISLTRTFNFYVEESEEADDNVYNEASSSTVSTNVSKTGSIIWAFNEGNNVDHPSVRSSDIQSYVSSATFSMGSTLSYTSSSSPIKINNKYFTAIGTTVNNEGAATANNSLTYTVICEEGYTFMPTSVSLVASRVGTDGGKIDISWVNDDGKTTIASAITPLRNNSSEGYSELYYSLSNISASQTGKLVLNIYNLEATKQIALADIVINGTVNGTATAVNVIGTGDINWAFNEGNNVDHPSVCSNDIQGYVSSATFSMGSTLSYTSSSSPIKINNKYFTAIGTTINNEGAATANNGLTYTVICEEGYTFMPTSVSLVASRVATDGGLIDISWVNDDGKTTIASAVAPPKHSSGGYSDFYYSLSNISASQIGKLVLNIYKLGETKQIALADIVINGNVYGSSIVTSITLKERATVFLPFKNGTKSVYIESDIPINNATVTLQRKLSNNYWNTFCVPFDITSDQIDEVFGGGEVLEFTKVNDETMLFTNTDYIHAGVPCLFKPANTVSNPKFVGVDVTSVEPQTVTIDGFSYVGHYVRYEMNNDNELYLSTTGDLKTALAAPNNYSLGLRATFIVPASASISNNVRVLFNEQMVSEGLDEVDEIDRIDGEYLQSLPVYNLNGQKVGTTRNNLDKGVYIVNGKKVVIN